MKSLIQKVKDYFLETDTNPKKDQPAAWEHKSESSDLKPKAQILSLWYTLVYSFLVVQSLQIMTNKAETCLWEQTSATVSYYFYCSHIWDRNSQSEFTLIKCTAMTAIHKFFPPSVCTPIL